MTAESFGHEHLDRLPHQLGPRVTKNPLGLSIDHDNPAGPVDHHHGVWRSLDDQSEALLALAQRQL